MKLYKVQHFSEAGHAIQGKKNFEAIDFRKQLLSTGSVLYLICNGQMKVGGFFSAKQKFTQAS